METKFQTSFIPKKPLMPPGGLAGATNPPRTHSTSIFMTLGVLLFLVSLVAAGGVFFWKSYLLKAQESYKDQLAEREKQFNADLIEELKRQNIKIDLAKQLIGSHLAISDIFDVIGRLTIEDVRFLSLDLTSGGNIGDGVKINMKGYGTSFSAVAFQSDVLGQLEQYGLRKVVKNPILSDPFLDANGTVAFGFSATIDPGSISYEKRIAEEASSTPQQ